MRKVITLILLCAGVFFAVVSARAEESVGGETPPAAAPKGRVTSIKGALTEIDTARNRIKVKEKTDEITIYVTEKTLIAAGKVERTLADLEPGDKVVAKFTEENGKKVARSIRVATLGKGGGTKQVLPEAEIPTEPPAATDAPQAEAPQP
jgi:Cu/Ag efflux protein CusF